MCRARRAGSCQTVAPSHLTGVGRGRGLPVNVRSTSVADHAFPGAGVSPATLNEETSVQKKSPENGARISGPSPFPKPSPAPTPASGRSTRSVTGRKGKPAAGGGQSPA